MKERGQEMNDRKLRYAAIIRVLETSDGKLLMEELETIFDRGLTAMSREGFVDASATLINVGAREVLVHLRSIRDRENES